MIKIGMLIADRYEVLEKVGTGGMSDVYKAKDHRLNRMVAVKVLKQEFAENATFVSKFRVEAQAAAGLMHPNIVNVYDVGEEKGTYYIIMELVNGITLKRYIEKKGRLEPREAVTVTIQVAMGLSAAHRGHIIHRDIKPQNIIISKEGKVKVTDFGIARASTSKTITSNVMGSVHYTSPEQARGGYSDEKSDIYSLGVTLFEMLTGHVPYDGETTVAVALQHIQDPFPSPRSEVSDIPFSVEQIVLKCCEKSPDRRYQTMDELASDLRRSLNDPDGTFVKRIGEENLSETRAMTKKDREEIRRRAGAETAGAAAEAAAGNSSGRGGAVQKDTGVFPDIRTGVKGSGISPDGTSPASEGEETQGIFPASGKQESSGKSPVASPGNRQRRNGEDPGPSKEEQYLSEEDPAEEEYEIEEDERRMDRMIRILSIVAVIVVGVVILLVAVNRRGSSEKADSVTAQTDVQESSVQDNGGQESESEETQEETQAEQTTVSMPHVIGLRLNAAQDALSAAGLGWEILYDTSDIYEEDVVMAASASEGTQVEKDSKITLTVVKIDKVKVPDVTNKKQADAEKALRDLGLLPVVKQEYDDEVGEGYVMDQEPEDDTSVAVGSNVTIVVSKGRDLTGMVKVPNLLGMTEQEASAELLRVGLSPGDTIVSDTSGRYAPGTVIGQSVEKDIYVEESTRVDLEVSGEPLYSYSARIEAPRRSEDPDYEEGVPVTLVIETEDGETIWNKTTTEFPVSVSVTGISSSRGILRMTYTHKVWEASGTAWTKSEEFSSDLVEKEVTMEIERDLTFTKE